MFGWLFGTTKNVDEPLAPDAILIESDALDEMDDFGDMLSDWFDEKCYEHAKRGGPFDGQHPLVTVDVVRRVRAQVLDQLGHPPGVV